MNNLGKAAETRACIYLKLHGYKILERNYTGRFGEIDIIGSKNNEITFFEANSARMTRSAAARQPLPIRSSRKS